jgi:hypothetical protein
MLLLTVVISPVMAQKAGAIGVGLVLGDHDGITGKYWLDSSRALDFGLGFHHDTTIYGDYLWHSWNAIRRQPSSGKLPVHLGLGAQLGSHTDHTLGLRAVGGIAYWFPRDPVEIFLDIVPVLQFGSDHGLDLTGSIGVRYYFNW